MAALLKNKGPMLNLFDDYPIHQTPEPLAYPGTTDPNFYDRSWFNGYNQDASCYFSFGMAVYPHRGIIDGAFSVVEAGGRQHCFYGSGRAPQERTNTTVGPLRLEIIEPLRRARIILEENDSGLACDLTFSARTSAIEEARQTLWTGTRRFMDATRFDQFGRWSGTVSHPDGEFKVDEDSWLGTKDRSWGVRRVGERVPVGAPNSTQSFFFLWAPLVWEDHITHAIFFDGPEGEALVREGLVSPFYASEADIPDELDLTATRMATAVHRVDYHPETRLAARAALDLIDLHGQVRTIDLEPQLRFQMKGLGYGHREWGQGVWKGELALGGESFDLADLDLLAPDNLHVQQVVVASDGQHQGIGVLEQLVFGPYGPAGFRDLLDGAQ